MKIAIATVQVPFIRGGAEILAQMLKQELLKRDYYADIVTIPFKWYPIETLINCIIMGRMLDLTEVNGEKIDIVIAMKFPALYTKHENKIIWLMHQHRQAYDLWGTDFGDIHKMEGGNELRDLIIKSDNKYINEAKHIYTISKNTSNRLKEFNNIHSVPLYHPPMNYNKFKCDSFEKFIFYPSRIDEMKRQRVLVEAARYIESDVKIYIAGSGSQKEIIYLKILIEKFNLEKKIKLLGYITEEEKLQYYSKCLAVYFGAYDEDYGYITLEAFFSKKPVIVHSDAGGPLEFVNDGQNGFVIKVSSKAVAEKIDILASNLNLAESMGIEGYNTLNKLNISWDKVIENLLK